MIKETKPGKLHIRTEGKLLAYRDEEPEWHT